MVLGAILSRRIRGVEDFLVAGRRANRWMISLSILATWVGVGTFVGGTGGSYDLGISFYWIHFSYMGATAWLGLYIIPKVRRTGVLTRASTDRQALRRQTQAGDVDPGLHRGYGRDRRDHPRQRDPDFLFSGDRFRSGADDGPGSHHRLRPAGWSVGGALDRLHPGRDADGNGHRDLRHRSGEAGWMGRVHGAASRRDGLIHRDAGIRNDGRLGRRGYRDRDGLPCAVRPWFVGQEHPGGTARLSCTAAFCAPSFTSFPTLWASWAAPPSVLEPSPTTFSSVSCRRDCPSCW